MARRPLDSIPEQPHPGKSGSANTVRSAQGESSTSGLKKHALSLENGLDHKQKELNGGALTVSGYSRSLNAKNRAGELSALLPETRNVHRNN